MEDNKANEDDRKNEEDGKKGKSKFPFADKLHCGVCLKKHELLLKFASIRALEGHRQKKHETVFNPTHPRNCHVCDKKFLTRAAMHDHLTMHTKEKLYACPKCEKSFPTKRGVVKHLVTHESTKKCSECEKSFQSSSELNTHKKKEHLNKRCLFCKQNFESKELLREHKNECGHEKRKQFYCALCEAPLSHRGNLERHLSGPWHIRKQKKYDEAKDNLLVQQDLNNFPLAPLFPCESCGSSFHSEDILVAHQEEMHKQPSDFKKRPYQCSWCKLSFKRGSHLNGHIKYKHLKTRNFKCDGCGIMLSTKNHLKRHKLTCRLQAMANVGQR